MKIMHIFCGSKFGGSTRVMVQLALAQAKRGDDIFICAPEENPLIQLLSDCTNIRFTKARPGQRFFRVRLLFECIANRVDLLHAHSSPSVRTAYLISLFSKAKAIGHAHNYNKSTAYRLVSRKGSIIAVSQSLKSFYVDICKISENKISVVYNAVSTKLINVSGEQREFYRDQLRLRLGVPRDQKVLIFAGTVGVDKGLDALLDLLPEGDFSLCICGSSISDVLSERLANVDQSPLRPSVHWLGFVPEIEDLIAGADVGILLSKKETFGLFAVEALSIGIPMICNSVGGLVEIYEIVCDGITLVDVEGNPGGVTEAIRLALSNDPFNDKKVTNISEKVNETFSEAKHMQNVDMVYKSLLF